MKVLFLYNIYTSIANTYWEYIEAFARYSKHEIDFIPANTVIPAYTDFSQYDCILIHYGLVLYQQNNWALDRYSKQIANFKGLKVYIAQDDYTLPQQTVKRIGELGIHHIFTAIEDKDTFDVIYDKKRLPNLTYDTVLLSYVAEDLLHIEKVPLERRPLDVVYRGNSLGYAVGQLGVEKFEIAMKMQEVAPKYNLKCDVDWRSSKKIFGDTWIDFLKQGRVMLCTESGSSLVHFDLGAKNKLYETIDICENAEDLQTFENAAEPYKYLLERDGEIMVTCISAKAFEAIACGTVLVCYEGRYSDVIKPDVHYIPLKKDWSNIADVVQKIKDIDYLSRIRERAYADIILSGKYSYNTLASFIDDRLEGLFEQYKCLKGSKGSLCRVPITKVYDLGMRFFFQSPVLYTFYYLKPRIIRALSRIWVGIKRKIVN